MKTKIFFVFLYLSTLAGLVLAQTPGFTYQAVLRSVDGEPMPNADVKIFFNLTDGPDGAILYREHQSLTTNELGMINTVVGTGEVETGSFADIISVPNLNIKLQAEIPGEPDIVDVGFGVVGAVPYALYGEDADADPQNEMQSLSLEGDSLKLSGMPGVSLNAVNFWEKTDSSYILRFEDFSRDEGNDFVAEVNNGSLSLSNREGGSSKTSCSTRIVKGGGQTEGMLVEVIGTAEPKEDDMAAVAEAKKSAQEAVNKYSVATSPLEAFTLALTGIGLGGERSPPQSYADWYAMETGDPEQDVEPISFGGNIQTVNEERKKVGLEVLTEEEFNKQVLSVEVLAKRNASELELRSNEGFSFTSGVVFEEKYFGEQFGVGSIVSSGTPGASGNQRSAATFGGTFSTANDDGLTTLSGYLPGTDPTNAVNVLFNGQNLGVVASINTEAAATNATYGANGQINTTSGTFAGSPDHGVHMVFANEGGPPTAYMRSTDTGSEVAANVITMLSAAPGRSDRDAAYAAPMGGEAAAYDRGTAQMINGEATVTCPEYFQWVADEASMTVTITPLSAESKGVAVIEKSNGGFKVKELHGGTGNYSFDYLVMCKRKGYEDFKVVRKKPELLQDQSKEILQHLPKGPMKSIRDLAPSKS